MWLLVFRKIIKNRWMMLALLCGFIVIVAMVSSVPVYTDGILQYMLTRDMESFQLQTSRYPGRYQVDLNLSYVPGNRCDVFTFFNESINRELLPNLEVPVQTRTRLLSASNMQVMTVDEAQRSADRVFVSVQTLTDMPDHVQMKAGRIYEPGIQEDGCFEVVMSETAMKKLQLQLDVPYYIGILTDKEFSQKFRVVGVIGESDYADPFWFNKLDNYVKHLFMDEATFEEVFMSDGVAKAVTNVTWFTAMDYHQITIESLPRLLSTVADHQVFYEQYRNYLRLQMPILDTLTVYESRTVQLQTTLWVILVPLLVMLALYIFMVSGLIVKNDENEIAVLRSRGSSSFQIFMIYLLMGLILGGVTLAVGPVVGYYLCRVIGAANGFLEFVQRTALPLKLRPTSYYYSAAAVGLFLLTMLYPAYMASRTTIVERKRKRSRFMDLPVWQRFFLDFLILGVAIYGYWSYDFLSTLLLQTGSSSMELAVDPLLFLNSSLFVLGAGLVFLRFYPWIVRLVFWIGRRWWPPALYASFVQVGRSTGQEQFLMLFILLSLAVGIFNANSARTLNQNMADKIYYSVGADVTLQAEWSSNAQEIQEALEAGQDSKGVITYIEPRFTPYRQVEGTDNAAKVFSTNAGVVRRGVSLSDSVKNVRIMGIEPAEFGKVAWFRDDLLPHHINEYLNLIVDAPKGVLVSRSLQEELELEVGDPIFITWGAQKGTECTIYAFIDYWPSYNPHIQAGCVVANLGFLQSTLVREPYEVWFSKSEEATDSQIAQSLSDLRIPVKKVTYANQYMIELKNDPLLQGLNGMLTLNFVITMLVTAIGFLIYWILSIRSRALQFGIFRAMGMSLRAVLGILLAEQGMISVMAILVGIVLGGLTSDMFMPMMQMVYSAAEQVPPFRVVALQGDYIKIYAVMGAILLAGLFILSRIVARIKIDQALKLGED